MAGGDRDGGGRGTPALPAGEESKTPASRGGACFRWFTGRTTRTCRSFLESLLPESEAKAGDREQAEKAGIVCGRSCRRALSTICTAWNTRRSTLSLLGMGRSLQVELPIAEAYIPCGPREPIDGLARRTTARRVLPSTRRTWNWARSFARPATWESTGWSCWANPVRARRPGHRQLAWRLASRQCLPEDLGLPAGMTPVLLRFRNLGRWRWRRRTECARSWNKRPTVTRLPTVWNLRGLTCGTATGAACCGSWMAWTR